MRDLTLSFLCLNSLYYQVCALAFHLPNFWIRWVPVIQGAIYCAFALTSFMVISELIHTLIRLRVRYHAPILYHVALFLLEVLIFVQVFTVMAFGLGIPSSIAVPTGAWMGLYFGVPTYVVVLIRSMIRARRKKPIVQLS